MFHRPAAISHIHAICSTLPNAGPVVGNWVGNWVSIWVDNWVSIWVDNWIQFGNYQLRASVRARAIVWLLKIKYLKYYLFRT